VICVVEGHNEKCSLSIQKRQWYICVNTYIVYLDLVCWYGWFQS